MITKRQQLKWLAKRFDSLPFGCDSIIMSDEVLGYIGYEHKITNQELKLERDKMSGKPEVDSSWHERGELPPVGCECIWVDESGVDGPAGSLYPSVGEVVSVCAHRQTPGGDVVAIFTWAPGDDGLSVAASRMPSDFRPRRTERDKAINEMVSVILDYDGYMITSATAELVARQLHYAGYHK